jgi:hypothetical protein
MFRFGFNGYMEHAFPQDDLRPISCRGRDSQGGIALTLIDSLDTLVVSVALCFFWGGKGGGARWMWVLGVSWVSGCSLLRYAGYMCHMLRYGCVPTLL